MKSTDTQFAAVEVPNCRTHSYTCILYMDALCCASAGERLSLLIRVAMCNPGESCWNILLYAACGRTWSFFKVFGNKYARRICPKNLDPPKIFTNWEKMPVEIYISGQVTATRSKFACILDSPHSHSPLQRRCRPRRPPPGHRTPEQLAVRTFPPHRPI